MAFQKNWALRSDPYAVARECRKRSTVSPRNSSAWRTDVLIWSDTLFVVVTALALDALIGDPDWLWRRLPHPVALIGSFIGLLDRMFNLETRSSVQRKFAGASVVVLLVAISALSGLLIEMVLRKIAFGNVLVGLVASTLIAQRSLCQHGSPLRIEISGERILID